jgi:hypothetical protein
VSSENVELVLSLQMGAGANASAVAGDEAATAAYLASIAAALDEDFECTMRFPGMGAVVYRGGVEALRAAWMDRLKHWAEHRAELEGVVEAGNKVVLFERVVVRSAPSAPDTVLALANVWTVEHSRLVRADFNVPQAEARAAYVKAA